MDLIRGGLSSAHVPFSVGKVAEPVMNHVNVSPILQAVQPVIRSMGGDEYYTDRAGVCVCVCVCLCTCIYTYITMLLAQVRTRQDIHTYIHTCMHT